MTPQEDSRREEEYLKRLLEPLRVCSRYQPKVGQGGRSGLSVDEFQELYGADPFYSWFGLDNPLMYAAHKAAGGITSVYRQIGIAGERLFRRVLMDSCGLTEEQAKWSYTVQTSAKKTRKLELDGRITIADASIEASAERVADWMGRAARDLGVDAGVLNSLKGPVFEVRQGYKSKDSKRQNADIANATNAYANGYFPCVVVLSAQIDSDIQIRYRNAKWAILTGSPLSSGDLRSTYTFAKDVLGYDLASFLRRHSPILKAEVETVLRSLLEQS